MIRLNDRGRVHRFEVDGREYLYDVHSGTAIHIREVDGAVMERMARGEGTEDLEARFGVAEVRRSVADIRDLVEAGQLGAAPPDFSPIRETVCERAVPCIAQGQLAPARAVDVFVSADCNLSCGYCWNKRGNFGGRAMRMTAETGRAVVDFLVQQGDASVDLLLFGGEPLLDVEFLEGFLTYAGERCAEHGKPVRFLANTNGTLLDDRRIDLIRRFGIATSVSFDGCREVQDRNRPGRNGRATYDAVTRGLWRYAHAMGTMPPVRVTMSPYSRSWIETFEHLRAMGVTSVATAWSFGDEDTVLDPRFAWSSEEKAARAHENLVAFAAHYLDYLCGLDEGEPVCNEMFFSGFVSQAFKGLRCHNCSMYSGANLAFGADGSIYPCMDAMAHPHMRMGDVFEGISDTGPLCAAATRMVDELPECAGCWIKYLCAGGCFVENHRYEDGYAFAPDRNECEASRRSLEVALAFMADLAERSPAMYRRYYGGLAEVSSC